VKSLVLCQATPRGWLADGKVIRVENAPTYFGPVDVTVRSEAAQGRIKATVVPPRRNPPEKLLLRLRHPQEKPLKAVTVNGKPWKDFDPARETITLPPEEGQIEVEATY
jgi:hypothetical protein